MSTVKKWQAVQRNVLERRLAGMKTAFAPTPASGWVKAIRGALGLTTRQLAERLDMTGSAITQLEERESQGKVTLELLERVADAMECKLVYAIVPKESFGSLQTIIEAKAYEYAKQLANEVEHSMRLEAQGASERERKTEVARIAKDLVDRSDSRIWNLPVSRKSKSSRK